MRDVDSVEQHGQLRGNQLRSQGLLGEGRQAEAALLQALAGEHEAARVPGESLHLVPASRDEDEEVAGVEVLFPLGTHNRRQPIDAVPHVGGLTCQQDSHRLGQQQHQSSTATRCARYSACVPFGKRKSSPRGSVTSSRSPFRTRGAGDAMTSTGRNVARGLPADSDRRTGVALDFLYSQYWNAPWGLRAWS